MTMVERYYYMSGILYMSGIIYERYYIRAVLYMSGIIYSLDIVEKRSLEVVWGCLRGNERTWLLSEVGRGVLCCVVLCCVVLVLLHDNLALTYMIDV